LDEISAARTHRPDVVIDWGFPPAALPIVRKLTEDGVQAWWFDGNRSVALDVFLSRKGHPATREDWDRQLASIDAHWPEIEPLFGERVLSVIAAGPTFMTNDDRLHAMGL